LRDIFQVKKTQYDVFFQSSGTEETASHQHCPALKFLIALSYPCLPGCAVALAAAYLEQPTCMLGIWLFPPGPENNVAFSLPWRKGTNLGLSVSCYICACLISLRP